MEILLVQICPLVPILVLLDSYCEISPRISGKRRETNDIALRWETKLSASTTSPTHSRLRSKGKETKVNLTSPTAGPSPPYS